jgi:hypothetical protein
VWWLEGVGSGLCPPPPVKVTIEPPNPSNCDWSDPAALAEAWVDRASELPRPVGSGDGDAEGVVLVGD